MAIIKPITDLHNTNEVSDICHARREPAFITNNGYGDEADSPDRGEQLPIVNQFIVKRSQYHLLLVVFSFMKQCFCVLLAGSDLSFRQPIGMTNTPSSRL